MERQNWDCGFLRGNQKYGFSWRIAFPDLKKNVFFLSLATLGSLIAAFELLVTARVI